MNAWGLDLSGLDLKSWLMLALLLISVSLMLIAAIGILRMPDLYLRTSVSSKGATLGVAAALLASVLHFDDLGVSSRAVAVIIFMLLTAPVAAHVLGRVAYYGNVPFWSKTQMDADLERDSGKVVE